MNMSCTKHGPANHYCKMTMGWTLPDTRILQLLFLSKTLQASSASHGGVYPQA